MYTASLSGVLGSRRRFLMVLWPAATAWSEYTRAPSLVQTTYCLPSSFLAHVASRISVPGMFPSTLSIFSGMWSTLMRWNMLFADSTRKSLEMKQGSKIIFLTEPSQLASLYTPKWSLDWLQSLTSPELVPTTRFCSLQDSAVTTSFGGTSIKGKLGLRSLSFLEWLETSTAPRIRSGRAKRRISPSLWPGGPVSALDPERLLSPPSALRFRDPKLRAESPGGSCVPAPLGKKKGGMSCTNSTHVKGIFITLTREQARVFLSSLHSSVIPFLKSSRKWLPVLEVRTPLIAEASLPELPLSALFSPVDRSRSQSRLSKAAAAPGALSDEKHSRRSSLSHLTPRSADVETLKDRVTRPVIRSTTSTVPMLVPRADRPTSPPASAGGSRAKAVHCWGRSRSIPSSLSSSNLAKSGAEKWWRYPPVSLFAVVARTWILPSPKPPPVGVLLARIWQRPFLGEWPANEIVGTTCFMV
mmetsp:Transcript_5406/g.19472  ORF Transcript_5406/g.19472 Transcript_5406/m.19472 type:complete len:471 (-) Transcript_5406:626-2038(-)